MTRVRVVNADCRAFLCRNAQLFDCIIADPPFNIGQIYNDFVDRMTESEYRQFSKEWISACWYRLKPGAAMVLHGSVKASREILRACFSLSLDQFIETEICWAYNFGQCNFGNFIDTHCRAVVLRKPATTDHPRKWYVEQILTPSKRLLSGDLRVTESRYKGMVPPGTVWGLESQDAIVLEPIEGSPNWGRIQGNNKERRKGHPNQLPEVYVRRLLSAYTQPGDVVFCPFGGSGTEATVAYKMGRHAVATEVSEMSCKSIRRRIESGSK